MKKDTILFLSLVASLSGYDDYSLGDILDHTSKYTEDMDTVQGHMNIEILRLLRDGFKEDEVYEMINTLLPEGMENLSESEKLIVRNDAKKLIRKRKENLNYE